MPSLPPTRIAEESRAPLRPGAGLRLRLWVGCLAGALVGAGGTWWVVGSRAVPAAPTDLAALVSWLAVVGGFALLAGVLAALWLDRGIVSHLRGLADGLRTGQVARLRGLPASSGWGELSLLTDSVQSLLAQHRQVVRANEELGLVRGQLAQLRDTLERWNETERWHELWAETGPIAPVAESLNRGLRRLDDVREQNLEVARQIRGALSEVTREAREGASQAERAFVEATSLLTTVRELQRLEAELSRGTGGAPAAAPAPDAGGSPPVEDAAREAIELLVAGSEASVRHLSEAVTGVHEVGEQVRLVSNRATLIALDTAVSGVSGAPVSPMLAAEMKQLALEVQGATGSVAVLVADIERAAAAAMERMREARARVAERLAALPGAPGATPGEGAPPAGDTERLLERVREMISDAAQKSERLSASGERISRAADRLVRELEQEQGELEGLEVRLAPPEPVPAAPRPAPEPARAPEAPLAPGRPAGLRLLGEEHLVRDDDGAAGGGREERT